MMPKNETNNVAMISNSGRIQDKSGVQLCDSCAERIFGHVFGRNIKVLRNRSNGVQTRKFSILNRVLQQDRKAGRIS